MDRDAVPHAMPVQSAGLTRREVETLSLLHDEEAVELLQALVQKRSDYPPGDCREVIQIVAQKLDRAGIPYQIFNKQVHQPSLIARLGEVGQVPRLMLHSHIDTVPAGELERWSVDPFGGEVRQGNVFGRGAGDDKGSVAAQVMALVTLARARFPLQGSLSLAVVSDEESGGLQGTHWLHDEGQLETGALLVGEQTANRVAIAERVACGIDLTVFGRSAHGAMPWAGENAVLKMARALTWLQDRLFPILQARRHPYLPPPTLNIGKIQGGIQWSIVPERCKVEMDRRLLPGETREIAMAEIRQALDEFAATVEPLNYELFSTGEVAANIDTPADDPFVVLANQALQDLCGEPRPLTGYVQTSDGRWFARDGIPIILFGPSDPAVAHATDEHVSIQQIVEAARYLTLLSMRWLGVTD
jgi:acetylornithine deacetylase/succinyl-diaminopimelate desuccinylase family protein